MITRSNSPTLSGRQDAHSNARLYTSPQDDSGCPACEWRNPAARFSTSSTTSPPASAPPSPWPQKNAFGVPIVDRRDASPVLSRTALCAASTSKPRKNGLPCLLMCPSRCRPPLECSRESAPGSWPLDGCAENAPPAHRQRERQRRDRSHARMRHQSPCRRPRRLLRRTARSSFSDSRLQLIEQLQQLCPSAGWPRAAAAATPAAFFPPCSTASASVARPGSAPAPATGSSPACACAPACDDARATAARPARAVGTQIRGKRSSGQKLQQQLRISPVGLLLALESVIQRTKICHPVYNTRHHHLGHRRMFSVFQPLIGALELWYQTGRALPRLHQQTA